MKARLIDGLSYFCTMNQILPSFSEKDTILFIDDECLLCNQLVSFILKFEKNHQLQFASLQKVKNYSFFQNLNQSTVVIWHKGKFFTKSDAVLICVDFLKIYFFWLKLFYFLPKPIRDLLYDLIAGNRYKIFGKTSSCILESTPLKERVVNFEKD